MLGHPDRPKLEGDENCGLAALSYRHLGAAATDVDPQQALTCTGPLSGSNCERNEACFFNPGKQVDVHSRLIGYPSQEFVPILGFTSSAGSNRDQFFGTVFTGSTVESANGSNGPVHGVVRQLAIACNAAPKTYHLLPASENSEWSFTVGLDYHKVNRVRTYIESANDHEKWESEVKISAIALKLTSPLFGDALVGNCRLTKSTISRQAAGRVRSLRRYPDRLRLVYRDG